MQYFLHRSVDKSGDNLSISDNSAGSPLFEITSLSRKGRSAS